MSLEDLLAQEPPQWDGRALAKWCAAVLAAATPQTRRRATLAILEATRKNPAHQLPTLDLLDAGREVVMPLAGVLRAALRVCKDPPLPGARFEARNIWHDCLRQMMALPWSDDVAAALSTLDDGELYDVARVFDSLQLKGS